MWEKLEPTQSVSFRIVLMLAAAWSASSLYAEEGYPPRTTAANHAPIASNGESLQSFLDRTIVERRDRVRRLHHGIRSLLELQKVRTNPETDDDQKPSVQLPEPPSDEAVVPSSPEAPESPEDQESPDPQPEIRTPKPPHATPMTDRPVDRLAAADNLFGAGEIHHALALYRQLLEADLPDSERRWIRYQIACCQRRLGEIGNAMKDYRELANDATKDTISEYARWFLDVSSQRTGLLSQIDDLTTTLQFLEAQTRDELPR